MKELEEVKGAFRGLMSASRPSLFLLYLGKKIEELEEALEREQKSNKPLQASPETRAA